LSNEVIEEEENIELSLQEKMQLSSRRSLAFFRYTVAVIILAFCFLIFSLIAGGNESISKIFAEDSDPIYDGVGIALISLGAWVVWFGVHGRKIKKELAKIRYDYTNQAYYFELSTAIIGKEEDISMDFFQIARNIFPELKQEDIISIKKTGEEVEVEHLTLEDVKIKKHKKEYIFDVVLKTKAGFFLIKDFGDKKVTFEDLLQEILSEKLNGLIVMKLNQVLKKLV